MTSRAPFVAPLLDHATGLRVCVWCEADLSSAHARARFCSHACRTAFHNTPEKKHARYERAGGAAGRKARKAAR